MKKSRDTARIEAGKLVQELTVGYRTPKDPREKTAELLELCERWARVFHGGHFIIMWFTTHIKAFFGTPDLDTGEGREYVRNRKAYQTIEEALLGAVADDCQQMFDSLAPF